ncbi:MAG: DNA mismatch repair protein MutS, partial [Methanobacteriota archaeon]
MPHDPSPSGKTTPVMEQYQAIKEKHPDTILFFHIGDFYETFGSDAELVARELEIVLTSRSKDRSGARIPLAGVPYHAVEGYINRLIGKGYRVAVCDQVEDARHAKGIVRREVVRVITPGTVIDSGLLPSAKACYLMACMPEGSALGLAFLDISTGDFFVSVCPGEEPLDEFSTVLAQYRPAECVVPDRLPEAVRERLRNRSIVVTPFRDEAFSLAAAERALLDQFHVTTLEGYGLRDQPAAVRAAGAALCYARETQKSPLAHIGSIALRPAAGAMMLDAITLRNLEIFENIRGGSADATLLATLDRTETPMGGRLLRAWLTRPLLDVAAIAARLDAVEYLVRNPRIRGELRSLLHCCSDIERIAGRIAYGNATPRDLVTLRHTLDAIPGIRRILDTVYSGGEPAAIAKALEDCMPLPETAALIGRAIVDDPSPNIRSGGVIRSGYDQPLDGLRQLATSGRDWIAAFQAEERGKTGIRSLKVGYTSVFGYYIEVTKPNVGAVPAHYERKQTTSTGERYTTRELREKEAQIATADERLLAVEGDLYTALLATLRAQVPAF